MSELKSFERKNNIQDAHLVFLNEKPVSLIGYFSNPNYPPKDDPEKTSGSSHHLPTINYPLLIREPGSVEQYKFSQHSPARIHTNLLA